MIVRVPRDREVRRRGGGRECSLVKLMGSAEGRGIQGATDIAATCYVAPDHDRRPEDLWLLPHPLLADMGERVNLCKGKKEGRVGSQRWRQYVRKAASCLATSLMF